jgi:hypothetical protein
MRTSMRQFCPIDPTEIAIGVMAGPGHRDSPAGRPSSTGEVEAAVILKSVGRIPADFDIA